jgi:hypothetical protein
MGSEVFSSPEKWSLHGAFVGGADICSLPWKAVGQLQLSSGKKRLAEKILATRKKRIYIFF